MYVKYIPSTYPMLILWSYSQFIQVLMNCLSRILSPISFVCVYRSFWLDTLLVMKLPSHGSNNFLYCGKPKAISCLESKILQLRNSSHTFCGVWCTLLNLNPGFMAYMPHVKQQSISYQVHWYLCLWRLVFLFVCSFVFVSFFFKGEW